MIGPQDHLYSNRWRMWGHVQSVSTTHALMVWDDHEYGSDWCEHADLSQVGPASEQSRTLVSSPRLYDIQCCGPTWIPVHRDRYTQCAECNTAFTASDHARNGTLYLPERIRVPQISGASAQESSKAIKVAQDNAAKFAMAFGYLETSVSMSIAMLRREIGNSEETDDHLCPSPIADEVADLVRALNKARSLADGDLV